MLEQLRILAHLSLACWLGTASLAGQGGTGAILAKPGSGGSSAATAQEAPPKKTEQNAQEKAQEKPQSQPQSAVQQKEEQRARNHIAAAFPQTRQLLGYLNRVDAAAFRAVLDHSTRLARRREAVALNLAKQHHPELAELIRRLRRRFPKAYEAAIRELHADLANLQRARQSGEDDYQAALAEWKARSQVRLIAARLAPHELPEHRDELRALLAQGEAAKRRQVQQQIERYRRQIERLQRRLEQDSAQAVDQRLRQVEKQIHQKARTQKARTQKRR